MFHYSKQKEELFIGTTKDYDRVSSLLNEFQSYISKTSEELNQYATVTLNSNGIDRTSAFIYTINYENQKLIIDYSDLDTIKSWNVTHSQTNIDQIYLLSNGAISSSNRIFEFNVREEIRYSSPHKEQSFSSQDKKNGEVVGDYVQLAAPYPEMKMIYNEQNGYYDKEYKPKEEKPNGKYENERKVWYNPDGSLTQQEYHMSTTMSNTEEVISFIEQKISSFKAILEPMLESLRKIDMSVEKEKRNAEIKAKSLTACRSFFYYK